MHNPSRTHSEMTQLCRLVGRKEKSLEKYVGSIVETSSSEILCRQKQRSLSSKAEALRQIDVRSATDLKAKFVLEVDSDLMNQRQLQAERQYYITKLEEHYPPWIKSLNVIKDVADAKGHSNLLMWRSQVLLLLRQSLIEIEDDENATQFKVLLRKISLEINIPTAGALVRMMNAIREDYIRSLDSESTLKSTTLALLNLEDVLQRQTKIVPHGADEWSRDLYELKSGRSKRVPDSITNSSLFLHKVASLSKSLGRASTSDIFSNNKVTPPPPSAKATVRSSTAPHSSRGLQQVIGDLRRASSQGNFNEALRLFHQHFKSPGEDPQVKYGRFPVSLEIFYIVMHAFKNSKEQHFAQAYEVGI